MLEDFDLYIYYDDQEPIKVNTFYVQKDTLRTKMGLEPHQENS